MRLFEKLRKNSETHKIKGVSPRTEARSFSVIITEEKLRVERPNQKAEEIRWDDIKAIWLENTDQGPAISDIWLVLAGDAGVCVIPTDCDEYEEVYEIISKYPGFDFQAVIDSMSYAENARFVLWVKSTD